MSLRFWIRVNARLADDPEVQAFALEILPKQPDWLAIAATCGLLATLWGRVADERENGNLADVPDTAIERWAGWQGKRGLFASMFRARFVDSAGIVKEWDDYQGTLIARRREDRERKKRGRSARTPKEVPQDVLRTSSVNGNANGHPPDSAPYGAESQEGSPSALAPEGARPAPEQGNYLDRPSVRQALLVRGVRVPETLDLEMPVTDAAAEAREYESVLSEAASAWMESHPGETREIGRECRRDQHLPASGEISVMQTQNLRAAVVEEIRRRMNWPTQRSWQGEPFPLSEASCAAS